VIEDVVVDRESCEFGEWPTESAGPHPAYQQNPARAVYIWTDQGGWHVRNATGRDVDLTIATIGRPGLVVADGSSNDEGGETASEPATSSFLLSGDEQSGGVDFTIACDFLAVTFDLQVDGEPLPTSQIQLGRTVIPATNPFVVERESD
jgi:hypothetical protein